MSSLSLSFFFCSPPFLFLFSKTQSFKSFEALNQQQEQQTTQTLFDFNNCCCFIKTHLISINEFNKWKKNKKQSDKV